MDDSLNNLVEVWSEWIARTHDSEFTYDKCTQWDIGSLCKGGADVYKYLRLPGTFRHLSPDLVAQQVVTALSHRDDVELFVTTAYVPESCLDKVHWLKEHFPAIPEENVIFINNKSLLDLDILIDDGAHNVGSFKGTSLLIDRPWNQHFECDGIGVHRMQGWAEIEQTLPGLLDRRLIAPPAVPLHGLRQTTRSK